MKKTKKLKVIDLPAKINFLGYLGDIQGCGTIRVIYPYLLLNHFSYKDRVTAGGTYLSNFVYDPLFYKNFTFVQFQRAAEKYHLSLYNHIIREVRKYVKIPIIYEVDDLLFDIPEWNYASEYYKENNDNIKRLLELSDAIVVSTLPLKNHLSKYNKKIAVVPNHLSKFVWGEIYPKHLNEPREKKPRILWAGSQNHFSQDNKSGGDFGKKLIEFIIKTTDKYDWCLLGAFPYELLDYKDKIKVYPWVKIFQYPKTLKDIDADIGIAPLLKCDFNDCKCLAGDTNIVTINGIKEIKDIQIGDYIWQENDYKKVSQIVKYNNKKTIKIKTKLGFELEGTFNHRIRSNNEFKCLSDLNINDKVDISFFEFKNNYQYLSAPLFLTKKLDNFDSKLLNEDLLPKIKINERWGRFIGYILGNGYIGNGSGDIGISCNSKYKDVIDDLKKFSREIGLYEPTFVVEKVKKNESDCYKNGKKIDVVFNSRNLRWFLSEKIGFSGANCKNLNVPDIILKSPKSVIKEFIRGLFESNCIISRSNCSFTTKYKNLAKQIQFILLGFNILSKVITVKNKLYDKFYYTLILNREACDVFYKEINFLSAEKIKKLKNICNKKHSNAFKKWCLNDEIIEISYNVKDVYDIQVPDGQYYMANGIISHNSNIKQLEYVACGIPGVYSNAVPYSNATIKCETEEYMISKIEELASNIDLRSRVWKKDYQKVKDQLWWEENDNLKKYINSYLSLFGKKLP